MIIHLFYILYLKKQYKNNAVHNQRHYISFFIGSVHILTNVEQYHIVTNIYKDQCFILNMNTHPAKLTYCDLHIWTKLYILDKNTNKNIKQDPNSYMSNHAQKQSLMK